jgi:uncharacterized protein YkwD
MRRPALTALILAALASGCGSDNRNGGATAPAPAAAGQAQPVSAGITDGRLGAAVVARPGETKVSGKVRRITGRFTLPPSNAHGVGAEASCADAEVQPTAQNIAHVSDVIFCLMNAMRANEGVPALKQQAQLAQASVDHSQDMVDNKYFAHDSLDGRDVVARLEQASYIPKSGEWVVGENLAWGSGALATPKALVNAWMNSPPHRENLLSADFKEVGMGVFLGSPSQSAGDGVTVTTDFGTRVGSALSAAAGSTAGTTAALGGVASRRAASRRTASRRRAALRRCKRRHGAARRRCVRAARRIH